MVSNSVKDSKIPTPLLFGRIFGCSSKKVHPWILLCGEFRNSLEKNSLGHPPEYQVPPITAYIDTSGLHYTFESLQILRFV